MILPEYLAFDTYSSTIRLARISRSSNVLFRRSISLDESSGSVSEALLAGFEDNDDMAIAKGSVRKMG